MHCGMYGVCSLFIFVAFYCTHKNTHKWYFHNPWEMRSFLKTFENFCTFPKGWSSKPVAVALRAALRSASLRLTSSTTSFTTWWIFLTVVVDSSTCKLLRYVCMSYCDDAQLYTYSNGVFFYSICILYSSIVWTQNAKIWCKWMRCPI